MRTCEVRGQLQEPVLSFYHTRPGEQTQVVRLVRKCCHKLAHLLGPQSYFLKRDSKHMVHLQAGESNTKVWSVEWDYSFLPKGLFLSDYFPGDQ